MTPERWRRIEDLYHEALTLDGSERAGFLAKACQGDDELRRKVEALIEGHIRAGDFLAKPAVEVAAKSIAASKSVSLAGRQIGHYRIASLLGAGGMGEVYLAQDTRLERAAALKILPSDVASNQDRMQRFKREAKAACAFNHPNVATIYDIGEADGIHFIAMEYVEGKTLAARLAAGPLDAHEIVSIAMQADDALQAAHAKGITHRDIKPANLMITPEDQVKVLDFGLAKVSGFDGTMLNSDGITAPTTPGLVMGTVQYMSPEQILGRDVDHRSDIFSLGVVLYEMAARRLPFGGATATETMDQILHAQPEAIGQAGRIPAELERIARKCIEKDRERRYQSARELLVDLRNLQRDSQPAALIAEKPFHAHGRNRKRVLAGLAVSVLAAFLFALSPWSRTLQVNQPIGSIVVLPFTNDSGNPDSEYLADGITETLINSLSHLPNLRVIARTTAFTYKGKSVDPREVHRALNVGAVLTGRLVQRGDALTVQVDLIDGQAGTQLWGERYMPQQANLFAFQDEVIRQVLERLNLAPSAEQQQRMAKQYSEDAEAHQLYLRGRYHTLKFTKEGMDKGLDLMNQALRLDPRYALGYAGLSEAYMTASDWYMPSIEAGVKAKEAALKAITLDDSLSEAHTAMAYVLGWFDWDWQNAEREFKRAIELNPGSEPAHYVYGTTLGMIGRVEESIAELKRAQQLDPLSGPVTFELGRSLYFARRYDEALDRLKVASELTPSSFLGRIYLGNVYELKAMYAEAIAEYEKTLQVGVGFPDARAWIGHGLAVAGRTADARKTLNELSREKPFTTGPWGMAVLHLGLGDKDQAIAWLERARDDRFIVLPSLKIDPIFNGLRSDPRFAAILLSMNLTP